LQSFLKKLQGGREKKRRDRERGECLVKGTKKQEKEEIDKD